MLTTLRSTFLSLLCVVLSVAQAAAFDLFQPVLPARPFQAMAHRGVMKRAPENTRPAIELAAEDTIEWVEVDVRLTKDHQHVIVHNETVDKTSDGHGDVAALTMAKIKQLDAGSWFATRFAGTRFLSLRECLDVARGKVNLYLDCKEVDPKLLANEIVDAKMERQVVAYDTPEHITEMKTASGGKVATMTKWHTEFGFTEWPAKWKPDVVEINANEITPEVCKQFHDLGILVQAQVLNAEDRPERWDAMLAAGVDWLQTDHADEIIVHRFRKAYPACPVKISMHRGANRYAPENTLSAYEKALALGADYIEFDVRTTQDGQFMILHDDKLDRTTEARGSIKSATLASVRELDAGSWFGSPYVGSRVPTLDETIELIKGHAGLYVDAKDIPAEALTEKLRTRGVEAESVVYQSPEYLVKLKGLLPKVGTLCPLKDPAQLEALAKQVQPYAFDVSWDILSADLIRKCHDLGIKVFSDAFDEHETIEDYQRAIGWGIDVIQTDYPLHLIRALETSVK